jgi:hypothetical protein
MIINIANIDKAKVLKKLYENARVTRPEIAFFSDINEFTVEMARNHLKQNGNIDYINGRTLNVNLSCDTFDSTLYDRVNGYTSAYNALQYILPNINIPTAPEKQILQPYEVLDTIFKRDIVVDSGYSASSYGENLHALNYANANLQQFDDTFLKKLLDRSYSEGGGGLFGLGNEHTYTQREVIRRNEETLYTYLLFVSNKPPALMKEILLYDYLFKGIPAKNIADALVGDINYLRDNARSTSREKARPIISDILGDEEKVSIVLQSMSKDTSSKVASAFMKLYTFVLEHNSNEIQVDTFFKSMMHHVTKLKPYSLQDAIYKEIAATKANLLTDYPELKLLLSEILYGKYSSNDFEKSISIERSLKIIYEQDSKNFQENLKKAIFDENSSLYKALNQQIHTLGFTFWGPNTFLSTKTRSLQKFEAWAQSVSTKETSENLNSLS